MDFFSVTQWDHFKPPLRQAALGAEVLVEIWFDLQNTPVDVGQESLGLTLCWKNSVLNFTKYARFEKHWCFAEVNLFQAPGVFQEFAHGLHTVGCFLTVKQ